MTTMQFRSAIITLAGFGCAQINLVAQNIDKATFREPSGGFYQDSIMQDDIDVRERNNPQQRTKSFVVDFSGLDLPNKIDLYKEQQWRNKPISQGNTGSCWCFSTTSFLESEIYRIHKKQVKLSEMFTVYWEYVEKARHYIAERGNSLFDEGSEANAVTRIVKKYGAVPEEAYTGLINGRRYHNHETMVEEMKDYLASLKVSNAWDEETGIATIKAIMNYYMGEPPAGIIYNGKQISPVQYLNDVLRINTDDYVDILSYKQEPFYMQVEYKVPDNWWHSADYYNVPLNEFMNALKNAVRQGYTVSIGGDVSEPGFDRVTQCAIIPDFDVPSAYINDDARQFRFGNETTTDDHGMHLVGYMVKDGKDWYLIKDSGSGSRNNDRNAGEFGYYFFSEDYVKLMVHRDAVKDLLKSIKK